MSTTPESLTLTGDPKMDRALRIVAALEADDPRTFADEVSALVVEHNPRYAPIQSLIAHTIGRLLLRVDAAAPAAPGEAPSPAPAPQDGGPFSRLFGWLLGR